MKKRNVVIVLTVVVVAGLWFLFRPERLFINKSVNEGLPATASAAAAVNPWDRRLLWLASFTKALTTHPEQRRFIRPSRANVFFG